MLGSNPAWYRHTGVGVHLDHARASVFVTVVVVDTPPSVCLGCEITVVCLSRAGGCPRLIAIFIDKSATVVGTH
jgi:hypothetical protein